MMDKVGVSTNHNLCRKERRAEAVVTESNRGPSASVPLGQTGSSKKKKKKRSGTVTLLFSDWSSWLKVLYRRQLQVANTADTTHNTTALRLSQVTAAKCQSSIV